MVHNERKPWHINRKDVHFDIDEFMNPFIPPNPIKRFPKLVARFLGHREEPAKELGNIIISSWALLGAFLGLLVTGATYKFSDSLQSYHPPVLFASLGATAILDYNTIQSPLAQPRAAIVGHGLSATAGVCIAKLFELSSDADSLRWIAGPVACGVASWVMSMTNTVHPPGGATAVLAAVDPITIRMGWMFIPFIMLGSVLMFGVACLVNNIQRQFPVFWWTPQEVGTWWKQRKQRKGDIERVGCSKSADLDQESDDIVKIVEHQEAQQTVVIMPDRIILPEGLTLEGNTMQILQMVSGRLRERREAHHGDHGEEHDHGRILRLVSGTASHSSHATRVDTGSISDDEKK